MRDNPLINPSYSLQSALFSALLSQNYNLLKFNVLHRVPSLKIASHPSFFQVLLLWQLFPIFSLVDELLKGGTLVKHEKRNGHLYFVRQGKQRGRLYVVVPSQRFPDDVYVKSSIKQDGFRVLPQCFQPPFPGYAEMRRSVHPETSRIQLKVTFDTEGGLDKFSKPATMVSNVRFPDP